MRLRSRSSGEERILIRKAAIRPWPNPRRKAGRSSLCERCRDDKGIVKVVLVAILDLQSAPQQADGGKNQAERPQSILKVYSGFCRRHRHLKFPLTKMQEFLCNLKADATIARGQRPVYKCIRPLALQRAPPRRRIENIKQNIGIQKIFNAHSISSLVNFRPPVLICLSFSIVSKCRARRVWSGASSRA